MSHKYTPQGDRLVPFPIVEKPNENDEKYNVKPATMEGCKSDFLIGLFARDSKLFEQWLSIPKHLILEKHKYFFESKEVFEDGIDFRIEDDVITINGVLPLPSNKTRFVAIPILRRDDDCKQCCECDEKCDAVIEGGHPCTATYRKEVCPVCSDEDSVERLLKPHYKVIADYPNSPYKVDEIIYFPEKFPDDYPETMAGMDCTSRNIKGSKYGWKFFDRYPHLFKRLEWHEERATDEMPGYLKNAKHGHVIKVYGWEGFNIKNIPLFDYRISPLHPWSRGEASEWIPATQADYESFINQTKVG